MKAKPLPRVMLVGGGELGSAVAHRLVRSGMPVVMVDIKQPKCIRRNVCFAMACLEGTKEVEGVKAKHVATQEETSKAFDRGVIPVLTGDFREIAAALRPQVVVDARMLKMDSDVSRGLAPLVIGLGPGFTAGGNVHVVIETNRGHDLGRVIYSGSAEAFTGVPAEIRGFSKERVIRAPESGTFMSSAELGMIVDKGDVVGSIDVGRDAAEAGSSDAVAGSGAEAAGGGAEAAGTGARVSSSPDARADVAAPISGLLRGLIGDGTQVRRGQKIGDVDPRGSDLDPNTISDKGRAIGGGVLEAIMHWWSG